VSIAAIFEKLLGRPGRDDLYSIDILFYDAGIGRCPMEMIMGFQPDY